MVYKEMDSNQQPGIAESTSPGYRTPCIIIYVPGYVAIIRCSYILSFLFYCWTAEPLN